MTLAVIRRGRGCFAATAVAIARCHTITLSAFGAVLVMLEDRDPRRPASWSDSPKGLETTCSRVLIPIDFVAVAALIRVRCCLTALAKRKLRG